MFVIGDVVIDFTVKTSGILPSESVVYLEDLPQTQAGVAGNIGWYLTQLGAKVSLCAAVGRDEWGSQIVSDLDNIGIDTANINVVDGSTGFFIILVEQNGNRRMIGSRGANRGLKINSQQILNQDPDWVHLSGYVMLNKNGLEILREVKKAVKQRGIGYSIDIEGIAYTKKRLNLEDALILCNSEEFKEYYGKAGVDSDAKVIVKAGPEGAFVYTDGNRIHIPTIPQKAVDTTAAGDAFNAGMIYSVLKHKDLVDACRFANAVATHKVKFMGARAVLNMVEIQKIYEILSRS
ncbi:MAG: carbohydrate kinase family protein [Conexivisphaerales archaeon]